MAQETLVSTEKLINEFKQLINSNYQNAISTVTSNYRNATRSLQQMMGSNADEADEKFLESDILAQMTADEVHSLQSHLNDSRLIRDKLNWSHISSALMHELDDKISFS
eukprot:471573_1